MKSRRAGLPARIDTASLLYSKEYARTTSCFFIFRSHEDSVMNNGSVFVTVRTENYTEAVESGEEIGGS